MGFGGSGWWGRGIWEVGMGGCTSHVQLCKSTFIATPPLNKLANISYISWGGWWWGKGNLGVWWLGCGWCCAKTICLHTKCRRSALVTRKDYVKNTRSSTDHYLLCTPPLRKDFSNTFLERFFSAPCEWNSLDESIRKSDFNMFKKSVKQNFLSNVMIADCS